MSLLSEARDLALRQHRGEVLSAADRQFIADVVDEVSPPGQGPTRRGGHHDSVANSSPSM